MKEIKKVNLDGEEVFLRKGLDGWRIVHPIKNEDGTWNLPNLLYFGNIWILAKYLIIFALILAVMFAYMHDTSTCRETLTHLNDTCKDYWDVMTQTASSSPNLDFTNTINGTG